MPGPNGWRGLDGPLLATDNGTPGGGRMRQAHLWELVRRLARAAGLDCAEERSPHSLRHTAITLALDAGVPLRDVQDYAGHKDPRTTRQGTPGTTWTGAPPTRSPCISLSSNGVVERE